MGIDECLYECVIAINKLFDFISTEIECGSFFGKKLRAEFLTNLFGPIKPWSCLSEKLRKLDRQLRVRDCGLDKFVAVSFHEAQRQLGRLPGWAGLTTDGYG